MSELIDTIKKWKARCPTEDAIIGHMVHPLDEGADWLGKETYEWYWAIAKALRPRRIIEIGTRFGYSLCAMMKGSGLDNMGLDNMTLWSFDSENDHKGSSEYASKHLAGWRGSRFYACVVDTRTLSALWEGSPLLFDIAHVDGDHSEKGCYEDCCLVLPVVRPGGVILVDDIKGDVKGDTHPKDAADRFCKEKGLKAEYLDTYNGMYVIEVP